MFSLFHKPVGFKETVMQQTPETMGKIFLKHMHMNWAFTPPFQQANFVLHDNSVRYHVEAWFIERFPGRPKPLYDVRYNFSVHGRIFGNRILHVTAEEAKSMAVTDLMSKAFTHYRSLKNSIDESNKNLNAEEKVTLLKKYC